MTTAIEARPMWAHQQDMFDFILDHDGVGMLAAEMRTGKTRVACELMAHYGSAGDTYLVLCPGVVCDVWGRELDQWFPDAVVHVRHPGRSGRSEVDMIDKLLRNHGKKVRVIVLNYEVAVTSKTVNDFVMNYKWAGVVMDESHRLANSRTKTSRLGWKLGKKEPMLRLCLSGTPLSHSPLSIFGQFRFLDDRIFGKYLTKFRARYAIVRPGPVPIIDGFQNQDELASIYARHAIQVKADDVLDMPQVVETDVPFHLTGASRLFYRDMYRDFVAVTSQNEFVADNVLTRLLRLQQITSGFLQHEDVLERLGEDRQTALVDLILEMAPDDQPVVVFYRFVEEGRQIQQAAEIMKRPYQEVSGQRSDLDEGHLRPVEGNNQILAVQIQAGGLGINLSKANLCVFYNRSYSLSDMDQARARLKAANKKETIGIYNLVGSGTVDEMVTVALEKRMGLIDYIEQEAKKRRKK